MKNFSTQTGNKKEKLKDQKSTLYVVLMAGKLDAKSLQFWLSISIITIFISIYPKSTFGNISDYFTLIKLTNLIILEIYFLLNFLISDQFKLLKKSFF